MVEDHYKVYQAVENICNPLDARDRGVGHPLGILAIYDDQMSGYYNPIYY